MADAQTNDDTVSCASRRYASQAGWGDPTDVRILGQDGRIADAMRNPPSPNRKLRSAKKARPAYRSLATQPDCYTTQARRGLRGALQESATCSECLVCIKGGWERESTCALPGGRANPHAGHRLTIKWSWPSGEATCMRSALKKWRPAWLPSSVAVAAPRSCRSSSSRRAA